MFLLVEEGYEQKLGLASLFPNRCHRCSGVVTHSDLTNHNVNETSADIGIFTESSRTSYTSYNSGPTLHFLVAIDWITNSDDRLFE